MIDSGSGLLALPGSGWARDMVEVPSDTAATQVTLDVTWLPGKGGYPTYTRLKVRASCVLDRPFTGFETMNPNPYPISIRLLVALTASRADGSWVVERMVSPGPDVELPAGSDGTVVAASPDLTATITNWLALGHDHSFSVDARSSVAQPEFPQQP
jgi:hypothetical protein